MDVVVTSIVDRWRWALALDLGIFNAAVFVLAAVPLTTIIFAEAVVMVMSAVCLVGVITHAMRRVHIPGEQWSALGTAWTGTVTMGAYLGTSPPAPPAYSAAVPVFLLAGIASAVAAHLIDGAIQRHPDRSAGAR